MIFLGTPQLRGGVNIFFYKVSFEKHPNEQFVVEDEIFLLRLYHWRPRQPSTEMRKCKIGKEKVQNVDISHLYILQRVNCSKVICL